MTNPKEYMRVAMARWRKRNPERAKEIYRKGDLKRMYGLSVEDFDLLLASQGGVCAICQNPECRRRLSVDHDHLSGKIRGLLCDNCNNGLGRFQDSPDRLERAAKYLRGALDEKAGRV